MPKRHSNRTNDLESMFLRLEELVLANSGADEFEEVFKLIVAKLWDEQNPQCSRFYCRAEEEETYQVVVTLLREAEQAWPGIIEPVAIPALTPAHLQVCVDALAKHTLSDADFGVLDGFFEFMVSKSAKGAKGQYFTPRHVVDFCVRMLKPGRQETVLDPACGSGGFLIHTLGYLRRSHSLPEVGDCCADRLWGFDIDARVVRVAKAMMILGGDGHANIIQLNSLIQPNREQLSLLSSEGSVLTIEDICRSRMRKHKGFDIIMTNPPFAGEIKERQILDQYSASLGKPRMERDILFVERCVQLLRPGGKMAIVLPHNKLAAESYRDFREWLVRKARILAVIGLGRNTFLPHTHQKASVLFLQKREVGCPSSPNENIFFAVSEKDGKNAKGQFVFRPDGQETKVLWHKIDHDLLEIVERFHLFCQSEGLSAGE